MTIRNLQIFVAVAESGKMTDVAKKMYITQSSVSQAIAEIEKEYDVLLFERLSRNLYLTDVGKELLQYGRELLDMQQKIDEFLKDRTKSTSIRIGSCPTAGSSVLGPITYQLKQEVPDVKLIIDVSGTKSLEEKLLKNELDLALTDGHISHPDLIRQPCLDDRLVFICAQDHPFFGRESVCLADLAGQSLILREKGSLFRTRLENQLAERKIPYTVMGSCTNIGAIKNMVLYNHGVSIISRRMVQREVLSGILWACRIEDGSFESHFDIIYHKNKFFSDVMTRFVGLCEAFAEQERNGTARSRNMLTLIR